MAVAVLSDLFWLGGSACAGKSSAARRLSARYGLRLYSCDDRYEEHRRRVEPDRHPAFFEIQALSPRQLWRRPVRDQVRQLIAFYDEEFEMILEDLRALPPGEGVLVEGAGLLPARVAEVLGHPRQGVWLLAGREFRRLRYPDRGPWVGELLESCADPGGAFESWMRRDDLFARFVSRQAGRLGLTRLPVDGELGIAETVRTLAALLGLRPTTPPGPP